MTSKTQALPAPLLCTTIVFIICLQLLENVLSIFVHPRTYLSVLLMTGKKDGASKICFNVLKKSFFQTRLFWAKYSTTMPQRLLSTSYIFVSYWSVVKSTSLPPNIFNFWKWMNARWSERHFQSFEFLKIFGLAIHVNSVLT